MSEVDEMKPFIKDLASYVLDKIVDRVVSEIGGTRYSRDGGVLTKAEEKISSILAKKFIENREFEMLQKIDVDKIAHALNVKIVNGLARVDR